MGGRLRGDVVRRLAWPATEVERRRWLVIAIACGVLTTVLLIGAAMARAGSSPQGLTYMGPGSMGAHGAAPLSPLLQDGNLRPGVVAAAVLSCLPPLVLLLQALRVGSAARERKLAALRVIGASHAHLRRIASAEGAAAGLAGALVGLVCYLLVSVLSGRAANIYLRLVPALDVHDLWLAPLTLGLVAALGAWGARRSAADVVVAPQHVRVHISRPLPRSRAATAVVFVGLAVALATVTYHDRGSSMLSTLILIAAIALAVGALLLGTPYFLLAVVRRAARRGDPMALLASGRVAADPRAPGRVGAVAGVCAATIAGGTALVGNVIGMTWGQGYGPDAFQVSSVALAVAVALGALLICVVSLVVGAGEQIRDGARSTAVLTAFGVDDAALHRALLLQLRAATVPSALVGAVSAAVLIGLVGLSSLTWVFGIAGVVAALAAVRGAARLTAMLVRPQIAEATSADNLRTA